MKEKIEKIKSKLHEIVELIWKYLTPSAITSLLSYWGFRNEFISTFIFMITNTAVYIVDILYLSPNEEIKTEN